MNSSFILKPIKFRVHEKPIVSQFIIVLYSTWHLTKIAIQLIEHKYSCALLYLKKKKKSTISHRIYFFKVSVFLGEEKKAIVQCDYLQPVSKLYVLLGYLLECTGQLPHHEILQDIQHTSMWEQRYSNMNIYTNIY